MENLKEFTGKTLDLAIEEACSYFNATREKLEIEIVQDAKSGIFGIEGARKAKIRARRVHLREAVESVLGARGGELSLALRAEPSETPGESQPAGGSAAPHEDRPAGEEKRGRGRRRKTAAGGASQETSPVVAENAKMGAGATREGGPEGAAAAREAAEKRQTSQPAPGGGQDEKTSGEGGDAPQDAMAALDDDLEEPDESLPATPLEQLDADRLRQSVDQAVRKLTHPIVDGDPTLDISLGNGRVQVGIACEGDSGLLIGREGQTLAALQYLVSRIVSRDMDAAVRVRLDAGDYRLRQEEKLREMAMALAERVRQTGRSYSTRPLSSYHRRIVHVCLQDAQDVQTHSTGDGPLKRVVIQRKKGGRA